MSPNVLVHVKELCVFGVINLTILLNVSFLEASVIVLNVNNTEIDHIVDCPAKFGPRPSEPLQGHLAFADPPHGCTEIKPPNITMTPWMVLIQRDKCEFDVKVMNAQKAGYIAAIIHNVHSDDVIPMGSGSAIHDKIHIPSVMIGKTDGDYIRSLTLSFTVLVDWQPPFNPHILLPFAIVMGICFLLMVLLLVAKWIQGYRRERRSRLSTKHLKKLPIKKFKKGDQYDVCAICLDEYEDGEKIRVLPCAHCYHIKCIDHWLTKRKRTCPICKRKLFPGDHDTDTESETESESDNEAPSEVTPLLTAQNANRNPRRSHSDANAHPGTTLNASDSSSVDTMSDYDSLMTPSTSVDVHGSSSGNACVRVVRNNVNEESSSYDSDSEHGTVGNVQNPSIQIVDDHYEVVAAPLPAEVTDSAGKATGSRRFWDLRRNRDNQTNDTEEV